MATNEQQKALDAAIGRHRQVFWKRLNLPSRLA